MSSVWIFSEGENSESSSIIGIYLTKEKAIMAAEKYIENRNEKWELTYDEDMTYTLWKNGCDNLFVEQWKVEE